VVRIRESRLQSFGEECSKSLSMSFGAILRRADEHLYEIVVQGIEELALEAPFKLRIVEIAWMEIEIISVHRNRFIFEVDDDLDAFSLSARREVQQRVLIEAELREDAVEAGSYRIHARIVNTQLQYVQQPCTVTTRPA
jgi:hypothetical protein